MSDFVIQCPGVFNKKDKAEVKKYLDENRLIAQRGPVDVRALIRGKLPAATRVSGLRL